jgi:hypothetical protein
VARLVYILQSVERGTRMTRNASLKQRYTQWALSYPVPEFSKSSTSVSSAPFETPPAFYRTAKP